MFDLFLQRSQQNLDPLDKGFKDADKNLMVQIPAIFMDGVDTKWNIPKHANKKDPFSFNKGGNKVPIMLYKPQQ